MIYQLISFKIWLSPAFVMPPETSSNETRAKYSAYHDDALLHDAIQLEIMLNFILTLLPFFNVINATYY